MADKLCPRGVFDNLVFDGRLQLANLSATLTPKYEVRAEQFAQFQKKLSEAAAGEPSESGWQLQYQNPGQNFRGQTRQQPALQLLLKFAMSNQFAGTTEPQIKASDHGARQQRVTSNLYQRPAIGQFLFSTVLAGGQGIECGR